MPASWAFLFWLLDALVEDFISPEAPHRRRPRSLSGLVRLAGAPSKMDPAFEKINLAGSAQRQQIQGSLNHQEVTWKKDRSAALYSRENEEGRLRGGVDGHFAKPSPPTFVGSPPSRTGLRESPERHQTRDSLERWRLPSSRQGRRLRRDTVSGASTWGENARRRARCLASRCDRGRRRC